MTRGTVMPFNKRCRNCRKKFVSPRRESQFHSLSCSNVYRSKTKTQKRKEKTKDLTIKQRKLLKGMISGKSGTQAALDSYNVSGDPTDPEVRRVASRIASKEIAKPQLREAMEAIMDEEGISDRYLVSHLSRGLEASRTVAVASMNSDSGNDGQPKDASANSRDYVDIPDWNNRFKYFGTALQLRGHSKNEDSPAPSLIVNINILKREPLEQGEKAADAQEIIQPPARSLNIKIRGNGNT